MGLDEAWFKGNLLDLITLSYPVSGEYDGEDDGDDDAVVVCNSITPPRLAQPS